jgi:hypothetical protein
VFPIPAFIGRLDENYMGFRKCSVSQQIMSIGARLNEFEFPSIIVSALELSHDLQYGSTPGA